MKNKYFKAAVSLLFPSRSVWVEQPKAPEVKAQKETRETGDLLNQLKATKEQEVLKYWKLRDEIVNRLKDPEKKKYFTPQQLAVLSTHKEHKIRVAVAQHESTPPDVLKKMIENRDDSFVSEAASRNPKTPKDTGVKDLGVLYKPEDWKQRR